MHQNASDIGVGTTTERIAGIDLFRLAAAFAVVSLHVHFRGGLGEGAEVVIRLLCRWAVRFFFLVTGYFLERKAAARFRAAGSLRRLGVVFVTSSILFLPMDLVSLGLAGTVSYCVRGEFLLRGTHFHLWFLSSMGVGLLFVLLCDFVGWKGLLATGAAVSAIAALIGGAYLPLSESGLYLSRHFSSILFIYVGMLLFRHRPVMSYSLFLLVFGVVLQCVEALTLHRLFQRDPINHQLSVGTVLFAVGMFGVSLNLKTSSLSSVASNCGRAFSLGVYIVHPYCIWLCSGILGRVHCPSFLEAVLLVPLVFLTSILCLAFLRSYARPVFLLIEGDAGIVREMGSRIRARWARMPGIGLGG